MKNLHIIKPTYLDVYKKKQKITLLKHFNKLKKQPLNFGYALEKSVVFSSMIEGNTMDIDTYLKNSFSGMDKKNKKFIEIENLKEAYVFAQKNKLDFKNVLKCHKIASKNLIENKKYQGSIRDKDVNIFANGKLIYTGTKKENVKNEVNLYFKDIETLLNREMSINEVFYYASYLHVMFSQIHPFADGNGRTARLVEKWFLASKLGSKAWEIQSEKMYQKNILKYYTRISLGANYENINHNLVLPFLLMLPISLRIK